MDEETKQNYINNLNKIAPELDDGQIEAIIKLMEEYGDMEWRNGYHDS